MRGSQTLPGWRRTAAERRWGSGVSRQLAWSPPPRDDVGQVPHTAEVTSTRLMMNAATPRLPPTQRHQRIGDAPGGRGDYAAANSIAPASAWRRRWLGRSAPAAATASTRAGGSRGPPLQRVSLRDNPVEDMLAWRDVRGLPTSARTRPPAWAGRCASSSARTGPCPHPPTAISPPPRASPPGGESPARGGEQDGHPAPESSWSRSRMTPAASTSDALEGLFRKTHLRR